MRRALLDPAPRAFPKFVALTRRQRRGSVCAPDSQTIAQIEEWLFGDALAADSFISLLEEFFWRVVAAGVALDRASVHVGTLHPQLAGYGWVWMREDAIIDEMIVGLASRDQDAFRRNPLFLVFDEGQTVRGDPRDDEAAARFPLFMDLREQGLTDYIARPIGVRASYHNAATFGTCAPNRFSDSEIAGLNRLFDILALHAERHIAEMISRNIVDAYLGGVAGDEVLKGSVLRGGGRPIRAVVWVSDMRDFALRSDRLAPAEATAMLNLYFEATSGAVMDAGGEVLKFVGDGLLAVFPVEPAGEADAAERSLAAARDARARIVAMNADRPPEMPAAALPLASGVALHLGEVFFGNVGAPDRLDFTVIGRTVNEASRIEELTKTLDRDILVAAPVAALVEERLENMGDHALRGVAAPMRLFAG